MQFLWCMILTIDLCCNSQCLLRQLMKHHVNIGASNDRLSRCHVITEFLYGHFFTFYGITYC